MHLRLFTLRFSPSLGGFDDRALHGFLERVELLACREHFFVAEGAEHMACLVFWRPLEESEPSPGSRLERPRHNGAPKRTTAPEDLNEAQRRTFERLRAWRRERAEQEGVPPYIVFTNRQLIEIVRTRPESANGLSQIDGIGSAKIERYGTAILEFFEDPEVAP